MELFLDLDDCEYVRPKRTNKGKSKLTLTENYVCIDIETTGLDPDYCDIIEIGAVRVADGKFTDKFETLIHIDEPLASFITRLTGITDEMLGPAPELAAALADFCDFIRTDDVIVGHNVNFDINFLYDRLESELGYAFSNDFVDTMRMSRKLFPDMKNHKLSTLISEFKISDNVEHRALSDCTNTAECYNYMRRYIHDNEIYWEEAPKQKPRFIRSPRAKDIESQNTDFDENHPLYGKVCVFTGALNCMTRKEAMQFLADVGGINADSVTKKTNYLIVGNFDYCTTVQENKSSKVLKAEKYILSGQDIQILSENNFIDLLTAESEV